MARIPLDLLEEIMGVAPRMTREEFMKLPLRHREEIIMQVNSRLGDISENSLLFGKHPNTARQQELIAFLKSIGAY